MRALAVVCLLVVSALAVRADDEKKKEEKPKKPTTLSEAEKWAADAKDTLSVRKEVLKAYEQKIQMKRDLLQEAEALKKAGEKEGGVGGDTKVQQSEEAKKKAKAELKEAEEEYEDAERSLWKAEEEDAKAKKTLEKFKEKVADEAKKKAKEGA